MNTNYTEIWLLSWLRWGRWVAVSRSGILVNSLRPCRTIPHHCSEWVWIATYMRFYSQYISNQLIQPVTIALSYWIRSRRLVELELSWRRIESYLPLSSKRSCEWNIIFDMIVYFYALLSITFHCPLNVFMKYRKLSILLSQVWLNACRLFN